MKNRFSRSLLTAAAILATGIAAAEDRTALFSSLDAASLIGKPVTNSKWEQVARVDSVLLDPATGRVTFFVLSFVDKNERVALPFHALSLDTRGRARLNSKKSRPEGAVALGGIPSSVPPAPYVPSSLDPPTLEPALGFKAEVGSEAILQGTVTGSLTLPDEKGHRQVKLVVLAGGESVSVDLGPETALNELGLHVRPGDSVQIEARKVADGKFVASQVRCAGVNFRIPRN